MHNDIGTHPLLYGATVLNYGAEKKAMRDHGSGLRVMPISCLGQLRTEDTVIFLTLAYDLR